MCAGLGTIVATGLCVSALGFGSAKAQVIGVRTAVPAIATRATRPQPSGQAVFEKRCSGCHELDAHDRGPALRNVYGRIAGHQEGYRYSTALRTSWFTWNDANLDTWLQGPGRMILGVRMRIGALSPSERAAIIAYLKQVSPTQFGHKPD
jgi:cytochrome c